MSRRAVKLALAIIADDLTGALDTSAPFVAAGCRVAVATRPEGLDAALATDPAVVVVNTASRALAASAAAQTAGDVAAKVKAAKPRLTFKKIDSRLKGNVGVETAAIAGALGLDTVTVAPAVPEQGRLTRNGAVTGRGVEAPIAVAPLFGDLQVHVADAETDADLDRIVATGDWSQTLAVGARGLGAAFARRTGTGGGEPFVPQRATLFAIGSRDAITASQIAALDGVFLHDAPQGEFAGAVALPALLRCTGPHASAPEVARRFAADVARAIAGASPKVLVLSGGDTALAVLDALGIGLVSPRGEAPGGLPWFEIELRSGQIITVVVKSGGFGDSNSLAALLPPQPR